MHLRFKMLYSLLNAKFLSSSWRIITAYVMEIIIFFVTIFMLPDVAHTCKKASSLAFKKDNFPNGGIYCATDANVRSTVPLHHCKSSCLLSPKCTAVNYNVSDTTCTEISTPCTLATNDPTMEYIMFNKRVHGRCFTWVVRRELTKNHTRQVHDTIGDVRVARILYQSGFYPAYAIGGWCYTGTGTKRIDNRNNVCEVLVLSPSCTAAWVLYEAGQPLPTGAESAGPTTEGDATYPVMFAPEGEPDVYLIGYYTVTNGYGTISHANAHHHAITMRMLVLMWFNSVIVLALQITLKFHF